MADVKDTEQICREFIAKVVKDKNYDGDFKITPISTEGANYTSHLFITTLMKNGETVDLFAKVAAVGEKLRAQNPIRMYETEMLFYTNIAKFYHELEEKNNVPEENRLKIPKFFACDPETYKETLVLENLTTKGFTTHDRMQTVDWDYAAAAITELAKYHALSVAYHANYPEEFDKVAEKIKISLESTENQAFYEIVINRAVDVVREENKEKVKKLLEERVLNIETFTEYFKPNRLKVITHGDYRPSNLMHRKLEDGSLEVIPVDFQTAQVGCPITDLMYFIVTATDQTFRKDHFHRLVEHYYTRLSEALARLGLDPEKTYSREDFDFDMKEKKAYGLCIAVFLLPIVTVDAKKAPKVDKDMDMSSFSVELNEDLFPQRLNGIVDDYVRWGDL